MIAMIAFTTSACCTGSRLNQQAEIVTSPAVVIRGVLAGWIVVSEIPTRPRRFETWEVRISLEGRTQESRGSRGLSALPDWVGRFATDTPFRQIEFTVDGVTRTISAFPGSPDDKDLARF